MEGAPTKTSAEIMAEQDAMAMAKYGPGMIKKKPIKIPGKADQKYFDSADYNMQKEAAAKKGVKPTPDEVPVLPPKLEPSPSITRRISHMESMERSVD